MELIVAIFCDSVSSLNYCKDESQFSLFFACVLIRVRHMVMVHIVLADNFRVTVLVNQ